MQLELPDCPPTRDLPPEALRLELACALYARGKVGKTGGAELAGVDLVAFQRALGERSIESYTLDMVEAETGSLRRLFPQ
jgi:predicted HTH domain antitoxin